MRQLLLFIIIFSGTLFPQLKELEVKPTTQRGAIPVNRDNPDKAAIFFYTQFDNLQFWSNYGIIEIKGDPAGGKYIVIIEPVRQTLEVRAPGYKTEMIRLNDLQPRDVLYYEVLPKKEEYSGVSEIAITVQATPVDAPVYLDGILFPNNVSTKVPVGTHRLRVEKVGYVTHSEEIFISPERTFFSVNLNAIDPVPLTITSNPSGAEITIDGITRGTTPKSIFLFPGTYDLKLSLSSYLTVSETISISKDEQKNKFNYLLNKNSGSLRLLVIPTSATVKINREVVDASQTLELSPGLYQIEVESPNHYGIKTTLEIQRGDTKVEKISLVQKVGKLQFAITPPEADCILVEKGVEKYSWTGIKILNNIGVGEYELIAKAKGFKTYKKKLMISENQTNSLEIQMIPGNDVPNDMVFVEGGTFTMGCTSEQLDCESDEKPVRKITVASFYIGKYEVTQSWWESVMGGNPSEFKGPNLPVEDVSWYEILEFCNRISEKEGLTKAYKINGKTISCDFGASGYRLPTEAEWEFAARGGKRSTSKQYSGSDDISKVAWYWNNSGKETHEVGLLDPNELGIYDMSGNVWEFCWDWYSSESYKYLISENPSGSDSGKQKVLRGGGGWDYDLNSCRVANRNKIEPEGRDNFYGFRVVRKVVN